ncbi:MAG: tripartite tricarboxylate transporter substrate binding protein [Xanthobacteraceae bacterium]|nr:tripartite tricarboxylate transporter substrate binding protein [Xanthobacteraceae bacterium]
MGLHRRHVAAAIVACLLAGSTASTPAQDYPTRPVEVIVPFAAGGGTDLIARLMCEGLGQRLGQSFVAINRPGANTNVGTLAAIHAKPDGHTLLMASIGLAANPSLYTKLGFDPERDLAPIALIANVPTILVVGKTLPVDTLPSLVAYLETRPGELNYASYGVGSGPHLAAELFQSVTGTRIVHVPYSGGGPAALGVIGNTVQMLFSSVVPVLGMVRGGSMKAIAVAADRRLALLPEVPTFEENGVDYVSGTWFGMLAPAKTPAPVVAKLEAAIHEMLADPAIRARLAEQGAEVADLGREQFAGFLRAETARLSAVIRRANIRLD